MFVAYVTESEDSFELQMQFVISDEDLKRTDQLQKHVARFVGDDPAQLMAAADEFIASRRAASGAGAEGRNGEFARLKKRALEEDDSQNWFGDLFWLLRAYEGDDPARDALAAWMPKARRAVADLQAYRRPDAPAKDRQALAEDLWQWYALSRVNDLLLLAFQAAPAGLSCSAAPSEMYLETYKEPGADVFARWGRSGQRAWSQYLMFFAELGFDSFMHPDYSPFWHEIVEVNESPDPGQKPVVEHVFWPGLLFGQMLFSRAGVRVRAGRNAIVKEIAERSTLYFAYLRRWRATHDPSMGWGHNSQWRTEFRRDYATADSLLFNIDGIRPLGAVRSEGPAQTGAGRLEEEDSETDLDLTEEERIELLKNRCFVRCPKTSVDRYPYDSRCAEPRG